MVKEFPKDRDAKRTFLLEQVERIGATLRASGANSEELGTLAPEAVAALRDAGMFRLKLPAAVGGAEADPVTEMMVLEAPRLSRPHQWVVHHGRRDRDRFARRFLAAGRPRCGLRRRPHPDRVDFLFSGRPCRARAGRVPAQRPLALQQRHPPFRMVRGRHGGGGHRGGKRRPSDRHVLGAASKGRNALRQLGRRHRACAAPAAATARSRICSA